MSNIQIVVENSAPSQAKPARSVAWACNNIKASKRMKVLDYGCGKLRNLSVLNDYFNRIVLVDTIVQCERIKKLEIPTRNNVLIDEKKFWVSKDKYDIVFLICVLHIIPDAEHRKKIIKDMALKMKDNGLLVVDVPQGENYYRKKMKKENRYSDGYVFGNGDKKTFYKNYYANELDELIIDNNRFELFRKKAFDKHLVRIYRKCEEKHVIAE